MTMLIYDEWRGDIPVLTIEKPDYVPTIGSECFLGIAPGSKVERVIYDYEKKLILVICK